MKTLIALLWGFFLPAVDEDPAPGDDPAAPADDPAPDDGQQDLHFDADGGDASASDDKGGEDAAKLLAEERAARAAEKERFERELGELRARNAPAPAAATDEDFAREERRLADPNVSELERWQIQTNRSLRTEKQRTNAVLIAAADTADRAEFSQLSVTKPALYAKYNSRVEQVLAQERAKGNYAVKRAGILRFLIGDDAVEGKLTSKRAAPKAGEKSAAAPAVNRGKLPGARSDVSGKNAMSEHEKRRARLENVQI